jgi:hypothetical protein
MAVIFVVHVWWPSKRWMFLLTRDDAEAAANELMEAYARCDDCARITLAGTLDS